jgi:hypothetical protein
VNRRCLKLPELDRRPAVMPEVVSTELGVQAATTPIGRRWPGRPAVSFPVDGVPLSLSVQEGVEFLQRERRRPGVALANPGEGPD